MYHFKDLDRPRHNNVYHYDNQTIGQAFIDQVLCGGLIVDAFAGGGGTSTGIEWALGRSPDIAMNHDAEALAMHAANHPNTHHIEHNIWKINSAAVTKGKRVALLWGSPDCKHHSAAKGGKPRNKDIRDLAWVLVNWAKTTRPALLMVENVKEWADWGPLDPRGMPNKALRGQTFFKFVADLERLGYRVEYRIIRACDVGAPTIRKRLYLIARCDNYPIVWPTETHAPGKDARVKSREVVQFNSRLSGPMTAYRTAADCIDWSIDCHSIFMTRDEARELRKATGISVQRPLKPATMARVAHGVKRFVLDTEPFIVPLTHQGAHRSTAMSDPLPTLTAANRGEQALISKTFMSGCGGRAAQSAPKPTSEPFNAMTAKPDQIVVDAKLDQAPFITKFRTGAIGSAMDEGLPTVTANSHTPEGRPGCGTPLGLVAPYLVSVTHGYSGGKREYPIDEPIGTAAASNTHAVVEAGFTTYGQQGGLSRAADGPLHTIAASAKDQNQVVRTALIGSYYGEGSGGVQSRSNDLAEPLRTTSTENRHALITQEFTDPADGYVIRTDNTSGDPVRKGIHSKDEPLRTLSTAGGFAVAAPYFIQRYGERPASLGSAAQEPRTAPVTAPFNVIVPTGNMATFVQAEFGFDDAPTERAACLTAQYGSSIGSVVDGPVPALTAINKVGVVCADTALILKNNHGEKPYYGPGEPMHTAVAEGTTQAVVKAGFVAQHNTGKIGSAADGPLSTIMADGVRQSPVEVGLVSVSATFVAQMNTGLVGHSAETPFSTFVGKGCTQVPVAVELTKAASLTAFNQNRVGGDLDSPLGAVMAGAACHGVVQTDLAGSPTYMVNLKGSDRRMSATGEPLPAICAGGNHIGTVSAMVNYFGALQRPDLKNPMPTVTSVRRLALAEGEVTDPYYGLTEKQYLRARMAAEFLREHGCWDGGDVVIVKGRILSDISLRMLNAKELSRGQGFPENYVLDPIHNGKRLTATSQTRMIGNSVCPDAACSLVHSNTIEAYRLGPVKSRYVPWGEREYRRVTFAAAQMRDSVSADPQRLPEDAVDPDFAAPIVVKPRRGPRAANANRVVAPERRAINAA